MKNLDVLILFWHQVYLSDNAGGYVRLRQFLKRIPKDISYILLDNIPTIYGRDIQKNRIRLYSTPKILKGLRSRLFLVWLLLETFFAGCILYKNAKRVIKDSSCKVIYVPIGEFPQLYIPAFLLKKKFKHLKIVVDILNYELPADNPYAFYLKLRKSNISIFRACVTICMFYIGYWITNLTIQNFDYVFTVSPELVRVIKKIYKKNTIDYTPSGVDMTNILPSQSSKKYTGIYIGRLTVQKGVFELLEVWKNIVRFLPEAKLAIAGFGDPSLIQTLKMKIIEFNLTKNIVLFGMVDEKKKYKLLSESSFFLHLASYEPLFPVISILEGVANKLPVCMYDMPVVSSQKEIKKYPFFLIAKNGDSKGIANQILDYQRLSYNKKIKIRRLAEKYVRSYDWDAIASKEFTVIKSLLK